MAGSGAACCAPSSSPSTSTAWRSRSAARSGIALAPAHATDPAGLLKRADVAMYDAKATTRGMRVYEPELDAGDPRRLTLVAELRSALNAGRDPGARAAAGAAGRRARWSASRRSCAGSTPSWAPIRPDEFIPIAERSGLIGPLTTRVLDALARRRRRLARPGPRPRRSRSTSPPAACTTPTWSTRCPGCCAGTASRPSRLTLEVTEGSVMADPARAIAAAAPAARPRRAAVRRRLRHRLLVAVLPQAAAGPGGQDRPQLRHRPARPDGEDVAIVRAIVDLGRHLGLEVVAEGVEDQETWDLLAGMGCDLVQGWHLARPMPTDELVPVAAQPQRGTRRRRPPPRGLSRRAPAPPGRDGEPPEWRPTSADGGAVTYPEPGASAGRDAVQDRGGQLAAGPAPGSSA